jgi:hypothetical protein
LIKYIINSKVVVNFKGIEMAQVTKDDLQLALKAWELAREKALILNQNWGVFLKSQQALIRSMLDNGWTYDRAKRDVDDASTVHSEALQASWKEMDDRCQDYLDLEAKFLSQPQP